MAAEGWPLEASWWGGWLRAKECSRGRPQGTPRESQGIGGSDTLEVASSTGVPVKVTLAEFFPMHLST